MAPFTSIFYTLLFFVSTLAGSEVVPEPAVTAPALLQRSPLDEEYEFSRWAQQQARDIFKRQRNPGMAICYGTGGAICSLSLLVRCAFSLRGDEYTKCYCETGKVAIEVACQNCVDTYDLGGLSFNLTRWQSDCDKKGYTIAPIPSSALSSWSVFNASYTGNTTPLPRTGSVSLTGSLSVTRATGSGSGAAVTRSTSRSRLPGEGEPGVTRTFYGDPTGSKVSPLTTTTGVAPLQNVPLSGGGSSAAGSIGQDAERLRILCAWASCLAFFVGVMADIF